MVALVSVFEDVVMFERVRSESRVDDDETLEVVEGRDGMSREG